MPTTLRNQLARAKRKIADLEASNQRLTTALIRGPSYRRLLESDVDAVGVDQLSGKAPTPREKELARALEDAERRYRELELKHNATVEAMKLLGGNVTLQLPGQGVMFGPLRR